MPARCGRVDMSGQDGSVMKVGLWLGGVLVAAGTLVLAGYALYYFSQAFFDAEDIPLLLKVAVPAIAGGMLVLLAVVVIDRLKHRKRDSLQEVDY